MNKRILIIFNPKAGHQYPKNYQTHFLKQFKKYLPYFDYDWLITTPRLALQLEEIDFNLYQRIMIIGGDGTVKEVADFILINQINLPLAIIPQGSANVLASSLNIPITQSAAIKTACLGQIRKIDVGLLNQKHYFLICLAIGFWSKVVNETKRGLKIRLGFGAYLLNFLKQKKIYQNDFEFKMDSRLYKITGNTLVIANALSLFKLKPKQPVDFSDGKFDILISKNQNLSGFLTMGLFAITNKRFVPYLFRSKGKKISINTKILKNKTVQLDGEKIKVEKIKVEIIRNKLKIIAK